MAGLGHAGVAHVAHHAVAVAAVDAPVVADVADVGSFPLPRVSDVAPPHALEAEHQVTGFAEQQLLQENIGYKYKS